MKIRITKGRYWYTGKVGEEYEVDCRDGSDITGLVGYGDCEVISENETEGGEYMVIDGVKYREVKRKAAVGEKIKVTAEYSLGENIGGRVLTVIGYDFGLADTDGFWEVGSTLNLKDKEYVVLEPVTADASPEYPRIDIASSDDLAASDADLIVLQRELNGLRTKQAELTKQVDGLTDAFAKLALRTNSPAKTVVPQDKPKTRDEIVAQAVRDVAELMVTEIDTSDGRPTSKTFWPHRSSYTSYWPMHTVEFIVNRDKRTVVALVKTDNGEVDYRGIAKAAPGDVFNASIGRAIALRRALGLPVPTEYTNAPQPEGFRKGDVIEWTNGARYKLLDVNHPEYTFYSYAEDETFEPLRYLDGLNAAVIDDTGRYELEVSA